MFAVVLFPKKVAAALAMAVALAVVKSSVTSTWIYAEASCFWAAELSVPVWLGLASIY